MSRSTFQIKVTPVRGPRKPKAQPSDVKKYTHQLLDLIDNPYLLSKLETPDLFVSVVASAVRDLNR
jgi:hypothetical protein